MDTFPERVRAANTKLKTIIELCVAIIMYLRSNLSATTPANGVKNSTGICDKNTESDKMKTESVIL